MLNRPTHRRRNTATALTPMVKGIRLTTGAEFALRDAPKTPCRSAASEARRGGVLPARRARRAAALDGLSPLPADMLPIIGRAPRHEGLWFDFGHHHLGLTLGPVTGRLLAEMLTGAPTLTDPDALSGGAIWPNVTSVERAPQDWAHGWRAAGATIPGPAA